MSSNDENAVRRLITELRVEIDDAILRSKAAADVKGLYRVGPVAAIIEQDNVTVAVALSRSLARFGLDYSGGREVAE